MEKGKYQKVKGSAAAFAREAEAVMYVNVKVGNILLRRVAMWRRILLGLMAAGVWLAVAADRCVGQGTDAGALLKQAEEYQKQRQYEQTEATYKQVIALSPAGEAGLQGWVGLVKVYIRQKKDAEAAAAYGEMLAKFSQASGLANAVDSVADGYRGRKDYVRARQLYQYVVDSWPTSAAALNAQSEVVLTSALMDDGAGVSAGLEKLLTGYSDGEKVCKAVEWVGQRCGKLKRYARAQQVYEAYLSRRDSDAGAVWVVMSLAAADAAMGDGAGVEAALGRLGQLAVSESNAVKVRAAIGDFCRYLVEVRREKAELVEKMVGGRLLSDLSSGSAEKILDHLGDFYRDTRQYKKAEGIFEYVADTWRSSERAVEAQANIVRMYISAGDEPNATAGFSRLMEKFSGDKRIGWAVWYVAERYWDFGSMDKAVEKYKYVAEHWPSCERAIWANMRQVMARIRLGDAETAERELGGLLGNFAGHKDLAKVVHEVVEEYRNAGLYEEGRGLFAYLLENWDGDSGTALEFQVGIALESIKLGESEKAEAAIARVIADYNEHPNLPKALFQIAEEHYYSRNYLKTISLLERIQSQYAASEFSARSEVPFVLATCCKIAEQWDKAIENYERTIREYPKSKYAPWCAYNIGWIYTHVKKDYGKAIYWLEQQRKLYPEDTYARWALFDIGVIYVHRLKDYQKGAEVCQQYVDQYPNGTDLWGSLSNLATCYENIGNAEQAEEAWLRAYEKAKTEGLRTHCLERLEYLAERK